MLRMLILTAAAAALFGQCAPQPVYRGAVASGKRRVKAVPVKKNEIFTGVASYYGKKYQGRPTANGERFDMYKLTAAHKTMPFGTTLRVTNLKNGMQVVVRINDRGPFVKGRVLDLSFAAAREIGMLESGTARVRMEVIGLTAKVKKTK